MRKLALVAVIIGACLIWFGIQEYRVGAGASTEPVPVKLADLEAGTPLLDNHIRIGLHHCMYPLAVLEYRSDDDGKMGPSAKVTWTYTPLISDRHPYMGKIRALEKKYGGYDKIPKTAAWPKLGDFVVLLKSEVYETIGDIPRRRKFYESVAGLVINEVDPLGDEEKKLIRDGIPKIDFDKVFIVEHGRKPTSAAGSIGFVVAGGLLVLLPIAFAVRSLRKPRPFPAEEPAAQPEPAPDNPEEPADTQPLPPSDPNPYREE
jgi:hypothetical protein